MTELLTAPEGRHRSAVLVDQDLLDEDGADGESTTPPAPPRHAKGHPLLIRVLGERGTATAEYAVATMAAVGFAGLLVIILRGNEVREMLTELVRNALTVG